MTRIIDRHPEIGDWSRLLERGTIGTSVRFAGAPQGMELPATLSAAGPKRLIDIAGPKEAAQAITVSLTGRHIAQVGDGGPLNAFFFAEIEWGTEGFSAKAEVDIGVGTVFTVLASALRVSVQATDPELAGLVGAQASIGLRPSSHQVVRSFFTGNIPPVSSGPLIPVVPFAWSIGALGFNTVSLAPVSTFVDIFDSLGNLIGVAQLSNASDPGQASLPPPAASIQVRNPSSNTIAAWVHFRLTL